MRFAIAAVISSVFALGASAANAQPQSFPDRPVRLIDPYAPGGGSGLVARLIAPKLSEIWGRQVIVDNRPGASGAIGTEITARATPDGHTLCIGTSGSIAISPNVNKVPFDPVKDLIAITQTSAQAMLVVVHPSVPVSSIRELVAHARAQPGKLAYASSGTGGSGHLAAELFSALTQTKMIHVPYKGNGPALLAQVSGEVQLGFNNILAVLPHAQAGRLRALAATSPKRARAMPNLPTVAEAGVPGYDATSWNGIFAPAKTPRSIVNKINADLVKVLKMPDVNEKLLAVGSEPVGNSPEEFLAYVKLELARWGKIIRENNIRAE